MLGLAGCAAAVFAGAVVAAWVGGGESRFVRRPQLLRKIARDGAAPVRWFARASWWKRLAVLAAAAYVLYYFVPFAVALLQLAL